MAPWLHLQGVAEGLRNERHLRAAPGIQKATNLSVLVQAQAVVTLVMHMFKVPDCQGLAYADAERCNWVEGAHKHQATCTLSTLEQQPREHTAGTKAMCCPADFALKSCFCESPRCCLLTVQCFRLVCRVCQASQRHCLLNLPAITA